MTSTDESYLMDVSPDARAVQAIYFDGKMSREEYNRRCKLLWDAVAVPRLEALIPPCLRNWPGFDLPDELTAMAIECGINL